MIYLKDEAVGVTVEDDRLEAGSISVTDQMNQYQSATLRALTHAKAESLLRGLLRWKLETAGQEKTSELVHATIRDWMHHGVVRGGQ